MVAGICRYMIIKNPRFLIQENGLKEGTKKEYLGKLNKTHAINNGTTNGIHMPKIG
jgi:hypothetical protein